MARIFRTYQKGPFPVWRWWRQNNAIAATTPLHIRNILATLFALGPFDKLKNQLANQRHLSHRLLADYVCSANW